MPAWPVFAVVSVWAAAGLLGWQISRFHQHVIEHIDRQVRHLERFIMSETQDAVNALAAQLRKAQAEIVAKLADAQAQIDAAGVAEQVDLSALTEAAQALDDLVPDADPAPADPAA